MRSAITFAGTLALLYADPEDPAVVSLGVPQLDVRTLAGMLIKALELGDSDTAEALSYEVARITRRDPDPVAANLLRSARGVWRVQ